MKTGSSLQIGVAVLLLASCNLGSMTVPQPALAGTPGSPAGSSTEASGGAPTARATLPAVEALSSLMPSFDGLYWTSDLLVENHGDTARVLTGLPCGQALALLSSGEWLLTKQVPANEQANGILPAMALMERNGELLLLKLRDIVSETPATPTPDPALPATQPGTVEAGNPTGCQVNITKIVPQPIEAHGVEETQGTALGYPLLMDCLYTTDAVMVSVFYEGPGDFRAFLQFDAPNTIGEHPVDPSGLSLNVFHNPLSVMDFMSQADSEDSSGISFGAGSEPPGMVTVRSVVPMSGEIQLDNLADESGNPQTFKAGFRCGW